MPQVIGVRFRTSPRVYYFAPTEGEEYQLAEIHAVFGREIQHELAVVYRKLAIDNLHIQPARQYLFARGGENIVLLVEVGSRRGEVALGRLAHYGL